MRLFECAIQCTIIKVLFIEAENEDQAYTEAHNLFNPYSGENECVHEQTTMYILEAERG